MMCSDSGGFDSSVENLVTVSSVIRKLVFILLLEEIFECAY